MTDHDIGAVVAASVIFTIITMTIFLNSFVMLENRFVTWFSGLTSSPRWFTIWVMVMALWVPVRRLLLSHGILDSNGDFVVATVLWSCIPFMVENLLKSSSSKAMAVLTELVTSVQTELVHSESRDEVLLALLTRLLDKIEEAPK